MRSAVVFPSRGRAVFETCHQPLFRLWFCWHHMSPFVKSSGAPPRMHFTGIWDLPCTQNCLKDNFAAAFWRSAFFSQGMMGKVLGFLLVLKATSWLKWTLRTVTGLAVFFLFFFFSSLLINPIFIYTAAEVSEGKGKENYNNFLLEI